MIETYAYIKNTLFESKYSGYMFFVFLFVLFSRKFPLIESLYVFVPIFLSIYIFFGYGEIFEGKHQKILLTFVGMFFIWSIFSSMWSQFPLFTIKRSIYFLIITMGSFIAGYQLSNKNNNLILNSFLGLNIFIVSISFISLIANVPENAWTGGHGLGFLGFNNHQNKFGQYIYLTASPLLLFISNPKSSTKKRIVIYILLSLNLILIALSVSRGSILALFLTVALYSLLNYSFLKSIIVSILFILIISSTVFVTSNYFKRPQITIIKHEENFGERRYKTIIDSWDSAINGGLFGLGYGISDKRFKNPLLGYYDETSEGSIYRREKTVSILALIEEVGIVGLGLFLIILIYPIILLWNRINLQNYVFSFYQGTRIQYPASSFLLFTFSFLLSLNVYAQIESWWIGIGSAVMPLYFIFIGATVRMLKS